MEFACGFVYVAPPAQKRNRNSIKQSALLPPRHKIHPSSPPPPPATISKEQRVVEQKDDDSKKSWINKALYENPEVYQNKDILDQTLVPDLIVLHPPPPTQGEKKKTLMPPPMKLKLRTCSLPSGLDSILDSIASLLYDLPDPEEDDVKDPLALDYFWSSPESTRAELRYPETVPKMNPLQKSADLPPLPPRPAFMKKLPQYQVLPNITLSSDTSSSSASSPLASPPAPHIPLKIPADKQPLVGNPNVILITLGKIVTEENVNVMQKELATCTHCLSASESIYDNLVDRCYFCQPWKSSASPSSCQLFCPPPESQDYLLPLSPEPKAKSPYDSLIIFCIDISEAMSICTQVGERGQPAKKSRIQFVQKALLQCMQTLSERDPNTRVGLITFNDQVVLHGRESLCSHFLLGKELDDRDCVQKAAAGFPRPPRLWESREWLERKINSLSSLAEFTSSPLRLQKSGKVAVGPAVLVAITMASQQPGSKVVICTGSKASTMLGSLEVEDDDSRSLVPSSIFYEELAEQAANHGVMVSVTALAGTDCRLDKLGKLAERTRGKVAIVCPSELHAEFLQAAERTAIATHCTVTLLLPTALCTKGEKESAHRASREVGNVTSDTEITFQFQAKEEDAEALLSAGKVQLQLQIQYRRADGQAMLRVLSVSRKVTDDIALALSSVSLTIIQLNVCHSCSALSLRGRYRDAERDRATQKRLMERVVDVVRSSEEEQKQKQWDEITDPLYQRLHSYTRTKPSSMSDIQSLTDTGAMLLFGMKNASRMSLLRRSGAKPPL